MTEKLKQYGPLLAFALTALGWALDHSNYHGKMEAHLTATDTDVVEVKAEIKKIWEDLRHVVVR